MAKRGVLDHPKTLDLAGRLHICPPFAMGLLEALWHWTAKYKPSGDVTGTSPELFAASIRYAGDAAQLWNALIATRLLDQVDGRVLVHDWSQHADDAVRKYLYRAGANFADGSEPRRKQYRQSRDDGETQARQEQDSVTPQSCPPLPLPMPIPEPLPLPDKTPAPASPPPADGSFALESEMKAYLDRRFHDFRGLVHAWWRTANRCDMPWDASEQKHLKQFIAANPRITADDFDTLLMHRGQSEINPAERPRAWLATLTNYANGPLDRYGKPMSGRPEARVGARCDPDPDAPVWQAIFTAELLPDYGKLATVNEKAKLAMSLAPEHVPRDGLLEKLGEIIALRERHNQPSGKENR